MELLIIWLIFAAITAKVASNRGNDPGRGFVLGLLLGPLGLLIACISAKDMTEIERVTLLKGELKKCLYCAELINNSAIKCKHCGEIQPNTKPENMSESELNALIAKMQNKK